MANNYRENFVRDTTYAPDVWCCWMMLAALLMKAGAEPVASSNGTAKVTNTTIATQNFLPLTNVGSGGTNATVFAKEMNTFATITGLAGLVAATDNAPGSEGNYLTLDGVTVQIVDVLTPNSCKVRWPGAVVGTNIAAWQEKDITLYTYNPAALNTKAPWIVLAGPKTVRVPYSAVPTFLIGEDVTQGSGVNQRRGRVLGWSRGTTTPGVLVIDPYGDNAWDQSDITGVYTQQVLAGASIPSTPAFLRVQWVIAKSSNSFYEGSVFWQQYIVGTEDTQAFSAIAANDAACTASSPPGHDSGGVTSFPATGLVHIGYVKNTAAPYSQAAAAHQLFHGTNNANFLGPRAQILVPNLLAKPSNGLVMPRTADGSWVCAPHSSTPDAVLSPALFQRLDDGDQGDLSPFAHYSNQSPSIATYNRFRGIPAGSDASYGNLISTGLNYAQWCGYAARGGLGNAATRDFAVSFLAGVTTSVAGDMIAGNAAVAMRSANSQDGANGSTPPLIRENPILYTEGSRQTIDGKVFPKSPKGRPRYLTTDGAGGLLSSFDGYKWVQIAPYGTTRGVAMGPIDGVTIPASS